VFKPITKSTMPAEIPMLANKSFGSSFMASILAYF